MEPIWLVLMKAGLSPCANLQSPSGLRQSCTPTENDLVYRLTVCTAESGTSVRITNLF